MYQIGSLVGLTLACGPGENRRFNQVQISRMEPRLHRKIGSLVKGFGI